MFKKLFKRFEQEFAPITSEENAFFVDVTDLPSDKSTLNPLSGQPWDFAQDALAGSMLACQQLALTYALNDNREKAYLWATVALLAGHPDASELMRDLSPTAKRSRRFYLETCARKWYTDRKHVFEARKSSWAEKVAEARRMGIHDLDDRWW